MATSICGSCAAILIAGGLAACSDSGVNPDATNPRPDSGLAADSGPMTPPDTGVVVPDTGTPDSGAPDNGPTAMDAAPMDAFPMDASPMDARAPDATPMDATPPDSGPMLRSFTTVADPGPGALWVTASGEESAITDYAFPPAGADSTFMVDGWEVHIDRFIGVFDHVVLWDNPNMVPTDKSMHGAEVARVDGPWAVDFQKGGPLMGRGGGGERAVAIAAIRSRTGGQPFATNVPYGFRFSTVVPTYGTAYNVNLDTAGQADFAEMIADGYTVSMSGTATFRGTNCVGGAMYNYAQLPSPMRFKLGFKTPTNYVNCQNGTDLMGPGVGGEDHPRGPRP
jgi:hypothetical protein